MKQTSTTKPKGRPANDPGITWVGLALRVRRISMGLKAEDLAERVGVSRSSIHAYEADTYQPTSEVVDLLAAVLVCQRSYFSKPPSLPKR